MLCQQLQTQVVAEVDQAVEAVMQALEVLA
jgi:hypothetical protein